MASNTEINIGFLNDSDQIDVLEVVPDLTYDFHLESTDLVSIMNIIHRISPTFCVICRIQYITAANNASVRLLFTERYLQFRSESNLLKLDLTDTRYLLFGTLKQSISTLSPSFIRTLREDKMMGVCCISVGLLLEKITTWIDKKGDISRLLTTTTFANSIHKHLSEQKLLDLRLVSRDAKEMVVFKRPEIIFEQSDLPEDFDYTEKSFEDLCESTHGRRSRNYGLNVIYGIEFIVVEGKTEVSIKTYDTEGDQIRPVSPSVLTQPHIKLSIEITCDNHGIENENIIHALWSIIGDLRMNIYSIELDLECNTFEREDYNKFARVLSDIPNLTILKLSNGSIEFRPFLSSIKNIETLEDLEISRINMLTDMGSIPSVFSYYLKHLKSIKINHDCFVIRNDYDKRLKYDLIDVLVECLEHFRNLRSLGFTYNRSLANKLKSKLEYTQLPNITRLDLSGSELEGDMDIMVDIAKILIALENIKELDLSDCNLSMENLNDKSLGHILYRQKLYIYDEQGSYDVSMLDYLTRRKITVIIDEDEEDEEDEEEDDEEDEEFGEKLRARSWMIKIHDEDADEDGQTVVFKRLKNEDGQTAVFIENEDDEDDEDDEDEGWYDVDE
jgi:Leucine-rich repeat (LRR) protein